MTTEPMMVVIRDGEGRTLAIVPKESDEAVLKAIVGVLPGAKAFGLPSAGEHLIAAAALEDGAGKYAGKNPLTGLKPGEPFFFLRAQDALSAGAVDAYANSLQDAANGIRYSMPLNKHLMVATDLERSAEEVYNLANAFRAWQARNSERVKLPD